MLSLILTCFLQSQSQLFTGDLATAPLQEVLKISRKIQPSQKSTTTKKEINYYLQTYWLRKPGTERNTLDLPKTTIPRQKQELKNALCRLRMITAQNPKNSSGYTVIAILGGNYQGMQERVKITKKFVQSLKNKPYIILLTGDRELETSRSDDAPPLDKDAPTNCRNEEEAGLYLAKTNPTISMEIVNSPKQPKAKRATTSDNAIALKNWLIQHNIQKGQIVLVSTQPYAQYQLAAFLKHFTDTNYCFHILAGPLEDPFDDRMIAKCMDTLARWVYTEVIT